MEGLRLNHKYCWGRGARLALAAAVAGVCALIASPSPGSRCIPVVFGEGAARFSGLAHSRGMRSRRRREQPDHIFRIERPRSGRWPRIEPHRDRCRDRAAAPDPRARFAEPPQRSRHRLLLRRLVRADPGGIFGRFLPLCPGDDSDHGWPKAQYQNVADRGVSRETKHMTKRRLPLGCVQ